MYLSIFLYLTLVSVKMVFDIQNGFKLDQYYRSDCDLSGPRKPVDHKTCDADLNNIESYEHERMIPLIIFGSLKLIFDISILGLGVFFFYKICSFNPELLESSLEDD